MLISNPKKGLWGLVRLTALCGSMLLLLLAGAGLAMDAMTADELDSLSGRAGLSMVFSSTFTTKASFRTLSIGDGDGVGNNQVDNAGWLILKGNGTNTGELSITVPCGTELKVSAVTNCSGSAYSPGAGYNVISIPNGTPFFMFSLSDLDIGLKVPDTVYISLSNSSSVVTDTVGWIVVDRLMIDKANKESTLYIWAH